MPDKEIKGRSAMSSISDAILIETINKELRFHTLYDKYMLSPNAVKSNSVGYFSVLLFRFGYNQQAYFCIN